MKKIIFILMAAIFLAEAKSQLVANLQLPPVALTLKNQLWSMTLVNTTGQNLRLKVNVTLTDPANNATVMTAVTAEFNLAPGTRQMQQNDFMPIVYNVVNANYNIDNNPNGFLPIGNFDICYQFIKIINDYTENLAEECEALEIEPLSPPLLVFPEDEAEIETPRPVFNWIPPAPTTLFSNLSYDLRLVEVSGIQTPSDAIQQNSAIYSQQNINVQSAMYPPGLPALDTGKLYAWQVTANNNGSFISKSDVWVFRIGHFGSEGQQPVSGEPFAKLKPERGADYFLCTGMLKFHYDNYLNDDSVAISIYDLTDAESILFADSNYSLQAGQNFRQINLTSIQAFSNNHFYLVELINSRKEKWTGKFLYRRED